MQILLRAYQGARQATFSTVGSMIQVLEAPDRLDNHTEGWISPVIILLGSSQPVWLIHLPIDPKVSNLAQWQLL